MKTENPYIGRCHTLRFESEAQKKRFGLIAKASPEVSLNRYILEALRMRSERERAR